MTQSLRMRLNDKNDLNLKSYLPEILIFYIFALYNWIDFKYSSALLFQIYSASCKSKGDQTRQHATSAYGTKKIYFSFFVNI